MSHLFSFCTCRTGVVLVVVVVAAAAAAVGPVVG